LNETNKHVDLKIIKKYMTVIGKYIVLKKYDEILLRKWLDRLVILRNEIHDK
jgi:hypothetical protein